MEYYRKHILKNGKELIVRKVAPADAEQMIAFMRAVDAETPFLGREPGEFSRSLEEEKEHIEKGQRDNRIVWVVGEADGRIVGECETSAVRQRVRFLHRAVVGICVLKEFWRIGIGQALLTDTIGWCRESGYEQLELEVMAGNPAVHLYEKLGFTKIGLREHTMKYPDGTYADGYIMILPLEKGD